MAGINLPDIDRQDPEENIKTGETIMKTIYLFRHGDTVDAGSGPDYSRELTEEGRLRSAEMADHLKGNGIKFDLIISSGALRAEGTAFIIAGRFGYPVSGIVIDDMLYSSKNPEDILALIRKTPADLSSIVAVGHVPLLNDFASFVSNSPAEISLGKSSLVRIDFNTAEWNSITPGSGMVAFYKTFEKGKIVDAVTNVQK